MCIPNKIYSWYTHVGNHTFAVLNAEEIYNALNLKLCWVVITRWYTTTWNNSIALKYVHMSSCDFTVFPAPPGIKPSTFTLRMCVVPYTQGQKVCGPKYKHKQWSIQQKNWFVHACHMQVWYECSFWKVHHRNYEAHIGAFEEVCLVTNKQACMSAPWCIKCTNIEYRPRPYSTRWAALTVASKRCADQKPSAGDHQYKWRHLSFNSMCAAMWCNLPSMGSSYSWRQAKWQIWVDVT